MPNNLTDETEKNLTVKEHQFAENYAQHGNGAKAARDAGYAPNSARETARRKLTKPDISEAIEKFRSELVKSAEIPKRIAVARLQQLVFANLDMFTDKNGNLDLKQAKQTGAIKLVKKFKETHKANGDIVREIELHDPIRALSELGDLLYWKMKPSEFEDIMRKVAQSIQYLTELNPACEVETVIEAFALSKGLSVERIKEHLGITM